MFEPSSRQWSIAPNKVTGQWSWDEFFWYGDVGVVEARGWTILIYPLGGMSFGEERHGTSSSFVFNIVYGNGRKSRMFRSKRRAIVGILIRKNRGDHRILLVVRPKPSFPWWIALFVSRGSSSSLLNVWHWDVGLLLKIPGKYSVKELPVTHAIINFRLPAKFCNLLLWFLEILACYDICNMHFQRLVGYLLS
jgi:hypothetical protein